MGRVRVLIADDHAGVREELRELIAEQPELEVVGEAADGAEALALARAVRPDVIVMDVAMPHMDGVEATRHIHVELPLVRILGLSTTQSHDGQHPIERAGAEAYFSKDADIKRLIDRLRAVTPRDVE